ncbi:hypothetical protein BJY00DRAFT_317476 [Aspergillus carlsbadensis]|nr:hypothetical protein BJY00DRAFT_317476 [Aspergillus carlsbadensis]
MAIPKLPCSNCRKQHIKCDNAKPRCSRCEARGVECIPLERKALFRRGAKCIPGPGEWSVHEQTWVNSQPRKWRRPKTKTAVAAKSADVIGREGAIVRHADSLGREKQEIRTSGRSPEPQLPPPPLQVHVHVHEHVQGALEPQALSHTSHTSIIENMQSPRNGYVPTTCFKPLGALVSPAGGLQGWSLPSTPASDRSDNGVICGSP